MHKFIYSHNSYASHAIDTKVQKFKCGTSTENDAQTTSTRKAKYITTIDVATVYHDDKQSHWVSQRHWYAVSVCVRACVSLFFARFVYVWKMCMHLQTFAERVFHLFSQSNANCQPTNTYVFVCDVSKHIRIVIVVLWCVRNSSEAEQNTKNKTTTTTVTGQKEKVKHKHTTKLPNSTANHNHSNKNRVFNEQ